jgi:hypothetical protein
LHGEGRRVSEWTLFSSHGLVLVSISRNPRKTAREIADDVGITERRTTMIIRDLEQAAYIEKMKNGRRNIYRIDPDAPLVPRLSDTAVGDLLALFGWQPCENPQS